MFCKYTVFIAYKIYDSQFLTKKYSVFKYNSLK